MNTAGQYCVSVTGSNTCADSDCVFLILGATGIKTLFNGAVYLHPNPANDYFYVNTNSSQKLKTEIYNSMGELIFKKEFLGSLTVNTHSWAEGLYFVKADDNCIKVVVKH